MDAFEMNVAALLGIGVALLVGGFIMTRQLLRSYFRLQQEVLRGDVGEE